MPLSTDDSPHSSVDPSADSYVFSLNTYDRVQRQF